MNWSLLVALIGLSCLVFFLSIDPYSIDRIDNSSVLNSNVRVSGKVTEQRMFDHFSVFRINSMEVTCECTLPLKGKTVSVLGLVEEYNKKRQIKALEITVLE